MVNLSTALRMRPMSQFEAAARGISTKSVRASSALLKNVRGRPLTGEVNAPAYEVSNTFLMQSYFDSTLSERAILAQPPNQPIVPSTLSKDIMTAGYGLALTPNSQTPIAIQAFTGGQQGRSMTYRMKPGEVIYPFGRPDGIGENGQFSGFRWGLPFGWLGGGSATLVVLRTADAEVNWADAPNEVIYHRIRLPIWSGAEFDFPAAAGLYTGPLNWPQRFPWPAAVSGANSLTQRGRPGLAVFPTRTAMALVNPAGFLAVSDVRAFFIGSDDWVAPASGVASMADVKFVDLTWGSYDPISAGVAPPAPFNVAQPTEMFTGQLERFACNAGAVLFCAIDGSAGGLAIDVVRYGRL